MVTDDQYTRFLQLIALTEMYCKEYSKALQFCEYLGSIARESRAIRLKEYSRIYLHLLFYSGSGNIAESCEKQGNLIPF